MQRAHEDSLTCTRAVPHTKHLKASPVTPAALVSDLLSRTAAVFEAKPKTVSLLERTSILF